MLNSADIKKNCRIFGLIWSFLLILIFFKTKNNFSNENNLLFFLPFLSFVFFATAIFCPTAFYKLKIYQSWIFIGNKIGKINSIIIVFFLFFVIFTPISLFCKLIGKKFFTTKPDKKAVTYFSVANNNNQMNHQF